MFSLGTTELLVIFGILLVGAIIVVLPHWKIFGKAGFSPWLSLLMLVPVVSLVLLYFLAFAEWPSLRGRTTQV